MSEPLFFILVPVYKTEKYIRQCLDSVIGQTYKNFKVIVVDDGTPDNAGRICDEYAQEDGRIFVIHKENHGALSARCAAISYVKNNYDSNDAYFVFLDSDDTLKANALQVIAETVQKENCDLVFFGLERVCDGVFVSAYEQVSFTGTITDKRELYKRVFGNAAYNPLCRKAIKCSLMKDEDYSRFYHISNAEDLLQSIPIYRDCEKAVFIPEILYNYTVNPNSVTQSISFESYKIDSTVRSQVWNFIVSQGILTDEDKNEYLDYCREILQSQVLLLVQLKAAFRDKQKRLDAIRNDAYFAMLLETGASESKVSKWLKNGAYRRILGYTYIQKILRRI